MREYYSEQSPKRKYYRTSIPADLPFHSPTYIHSHATALVNRRVGKAEDNVANYMEMLRQHLVAVRNVDIQHAKTVYASLKQISEKVASYGINPDNLLPEKVKEATEKIDKFRRSLRREQGKTRIKLNDLMLQKLNEFEKTINVSIETAFQDTIFGNRLYDLFSSLLTSKFIKTRKQKENFKNTHKDLKDLTFTELKNTLDVDIDTFNNQIASSRGQYLDLTSVKNNTLFLAYWQQFLDDLQKSVPLLKENLTTETALEYDKYMQNIGEEITPKNIYQALGWYMELVSIVEQRNRTDITSEMQDTVDALSHGALVHQEGNKIIVQDSVGRTGHEKTTDIRFLVKEVGDTIDKIIAIGATLKSSGDEFHKTGLMIDSQDSQFNHQYNQFFDTVVYKDKQGEKTISSLLTYFLYNYRALQTFAITDDNAAAYKYIRGYYIEHNLVGNSEQTRDLINDRDFISGIPGDTATRLHVKLFNVIDEVFTSIIMTVFIKALLGSFFNADDIDKQVDFSIEGKQDKPLPIFLIAGGRRVWTYEVLGRAIEMMESANHNPKELLKTFQYYGFQKTFSMKDDLNDFTDSLKQLYYEKFLITHGSDGQDSLCPYDIEDHPRLERMLYSLNNMLNRGLRQNIGLKNPSDDILKQFFFRDWSVRFNYSNLT